MAEISTLHNHRPRKGREGSRPPPMSYKCGMGQGGGGGASWWGSSPDGPSVGMGQAFIPYHVVTENMPSQGSSSLKNALKFPAGAFSTEAATAREVSQHTE